MGFWTRFMSSREIHREVEMLERIWRNYNKLLGNVQLEHANRERFLSRIDRWNGRISMLNRELSFRAKNKGLKGRLKRFFGKPR